MFGHDSQPSKIYSYGARAPTLNLELVEEQLRGAHRYRNALVELERDRREAVQAAIRRVSPELVEVDAELADCEQKLSELRATIREQNARARAKTGSPEQREELQRLRASRRKIRAAQRELKTALYEDEEAKAALETIEASALDRAKALRAESGLYWGTYLTVEQALQGARKGAPPKFHRWTGEGKLAVQLQGGLSVEDCFAGRDSRLRIEPVRTEAWERGSPPRWRRTTAWLRIQSEGRAPVWATVPITLHRPLPEEAVVKWAYLVRRRVATHYRWRLQLVVAMEGGWAHADAAAEGRVALDLGWRLLERGLRIAYWLGEDGQSGELLLPREEIGRWQKAEELRSIRDRRFNQARDKLAGWLSGQETIPEWLAERTAHLRQWRAAARLAGLVIYWRANRFAGDEAAYESAESWRRRDKHLYEWEANQRRKAVAWRDDRYRNFAAQLRRRYRTAVVEDADWARLQRRPGETESVDGAARRYQRVASVGRLRQIVEESMAATLRVPSRQTTQQCSQCGELMHVDAAAGLYVRCPHCDRLWDQDENACRNLLEAARAPVAAKTP